MYIYDVRHLGLFVNDEPIVEYDPDNPDGQHVVSQFRDMDCFRNYWHRDDVDSGVMDLLQREAERQALERNFAP